MSRYHPTVEERFKAAVRGLDALGLMPTPTRLNLVLRGFARRTLNGKESKWRAEELTALGYERRYESVRGGLRCTPQWRRWATPLNTQHDLREQARRLGLEPA